MSPLDEYLAVIRAPATRTVYLACMRRIDKDPNQLLIMAQKDKRALEQLLIQFVIKERDRVSASYTRQPIIALRSFLNFHDVELKWGKIWAAMPKARFVARDRAPKLVEIRELLQFAEPRMKMVVLILASSGIRLGGFDGLKLGNIVNLDQGLARIRIYEGSNEEYWAFISPEARTAIEQYLEMRRQVGENLTPESPLVRERWNWAGDPRVARMVGISAISHRIAELWDRAAVQKIVKGGSTGRRKEFKQVHGFRKFFKTQATQKLSADDVETLMGHIVSYYKPSIEHLEKEYRKAVPVLTISEVEEVKREAAIDRKALEERLAALEAHVYQKQSVERELASVEAKIHALQEVEHGTP